MQAHDWSHYCCHLLSVDPEHEQSLNTQPIVPSTRGVQDSIFDIDWNGARALKRGLLRT